MENARRNKIGMNKDVCQKGTLFFDFEELKAWKEELAQNEHCKMG